MAWGVVSCLCLEASPVQYPLLRTTEEHHVFTGPGPPPNSWARHPKWSICSSHLPSVFPLLQVAEPSTQRGGFLGASAPGKGQTVAAHGSSAQAWASVGAEWQHFVL
ncbi:unnamed protein product [Nyctereutes procyonoides]|uniref:(raccoon dog) hypothetical protein n=1 Tax=Nyctereutes procyonoides TaxID=34880 RepID=A0A811XVB4_NYCPR|nr:unnamed protein product [Nyctereutes procyonoides]